jgi:hypothetical protein
MVTNLMLRITIQWLCIQHIESTWIEILEDRDLLKKKYKIILENIEK